MAGEDNERRLAAIMVADVAGYSRLMGADESGTLAAPKALRKDVFAPQVTAPQGPRRQADLRRGAGRNPHQHHR